MGAGVGCFGGSEFVAWLKIVARVLMASICLSPMLEKGALGVGSVVHVQVPPPQLWHFLLKRGMA